MEKKNNKKEIRKRNTADKTEPIPKPKTEKPKPSEQKQPEETPTKRIVDSITVYL